MTDVVLRSRRAPLARSPASPPMITAPPPAPSIINDPIDPLDQNIPLRYLREVGTRAVLRVFWDGDGACGDRGYHDGVIHLADSDRIEDFELGGDPSDHPAQCWPDHCDACGAARPAGLPSHAFQVFHSRLYEAPDRTIVEERAMSPGDCFHSTWTHDDKTGACWYWDDCSEPHLNVVLPHGGSWDVMSRANNCDRKEDRRHRCWCAHGDPSRGELVTVDKVGVTCGAGGGSILSRGYHGVLQRSILRRC